MVKALALCVCILAILSMCTLYGSTEHKESTVHYDTLVPLSLVLGSLSTMVILTWKIATDRTNILDRLSKLEEDVKQLKKEKVRDGKG